MEKIIANKPVELNDEGYLKNFSQWDQQVATEIAQEEGIQLNDNHWKVINYIQDQHKKTHH